MAHDPTIEDEMTAGGYVRCSGCGGFLPAGAICGYCLQRQQQNASIAAPVMRAKPKKTKPLRAVLMIGLCALAVCGIGVAAVVAAQKFTKSASSMATKAPPTDLPSALSQLEDSGAGNMLASEQGQELMSALSSGKTNDAVQLLAARGSEPEPTMQATAPAETPPVMQQTAAPTPPVLVAENGMPDDVRRWLEHLHRIEQTRISLAATQLQESVRSLVNLQAGDLTSAMGDDEEDTSQEAARRKQNDRTRKVGGDMHSLQQAWRTLSSAFNSVPPPAECLAIKGNYDQVIGQTSAMILDIIGQLKAAENDPQAALAALTSMQGTSSSKIDAPARAADQGVAGICRKYDTKKWFDIQSDVGGGTLGRLGF